MHNFVACNKVAGCCFCGKTTGSLPLLLEPTLPLCPLSLLLPASPPAEPLSRSDRCSTHDGRVFSTQLALANPLCSLPIGTFVVNPPRVYRFPLLPPAFGTWKNHPLLPPPSQNSSAPACSRTLAFENYRCTNSVLVNRSVFTKA